MSAVLSRGKTFLFVWLTQFYTEAQYRPVTLIVKASLKGPATNIISGFAVGMETPAVPVFVISAALLLSYGFACRRWGTLAIKAVGRPAQRVVEDVRAQSEENPGIMQGTSKADDARCVGIVTGAALREQPGWGKNDASRCCTA